MVVFGQQLEIQFSWAKMSPIFVISVKKYTSLQILSQFGVSRQNRNFSTEIFTQIKGVVDKVFDAGETFHAHIRTQKGRLP